MTKRSAFSPQGEKTQNIPYELAYRIAIHEAGHAIAAIAFNVSQNVTVSMLRTGKNLAATNFDLPLGAVTRKVVDRRIAVALAGRAAEEILLGDPSAGAGGDENSDLGTAIGLAGSAVLLWGLSSSRELRWGVASRAAIIREVNRLLNTAYGRALEQVRERRWQVRAVAYALLKGRTLSHEEITAVMARSEMEPKKGTVRSPKKRR
jgi:cell division protease FtsH